MVSSDFIWINEFLSVQFQAPKFPCLGSGVHNFDRHVPSSGRINPFDVWRKRVVVRERFVYLVYIQIDLGKVTASLICGYIANRATCGDQIGWNGLHGIHEVPREERANNNQRDECFKRYVWLQ